MRRRASRMVSGQAANNTSIQVNEEGDWRQKYPPFEYASEKIEIKENPFGFSPPSRLAELLGGNSILPNKTLVDTIKKLEKRVI